MKKFLTTTRLLYVIIIFLILFLIALLCYENGVFNYDQYHFFKIFAMAGVLLTCIIKCMDCFYNLFEASDYLESDEFQERMEENAQEQKVDEMRKETLSKIADDYYYLIINAYPLDKIKTVNLNHYNIFIVYINEQELNIAECVHNKQDEERIYELESLYNSYIPFQRMENKVQEKFEMEHIFHE